MNKFFLLFLIVFGFLNQNIFAQYERNGGSGKQKQKSIRNAFDGPSYKRIYPDSPRKAICFSLQASVQEPFGNLYNRFGFSKAVGMSIYYKSKSNFCVGILGDYFFGSNVKDSNLFKNISTSDGKIITETGDYADIRLYERGYYTGATFGYISNKLLSSNRNTGLSFWFSCGYMEHKIKILGDNVLQLTDAYKAGYDRLTAGFFIQEGIFYNHMSINHLINYRIGFECLQGFTTGLRTVNFDTGESGKQRRFEGLFGLKFGWFLPVNLKDSQQDYTF